MRMGRLLAVGLALFLLLGSSAAAEENNGSSAAKASSPPRALGVGRSSDQVESLPAAIQAKPQGVDSPAATKVEPLKVVNTVAPSNVNLRFVVGKSAMTVNGEEKQLDTPPIIREGRTMLPVRSLAESMGAVVKWDDQARAATITLGPTAMVLWLDKPEALVNSVPTPIDPDNPKVVPVEQNGRTLLPARFIAENLGVKVKWNEKEESVVLTNDSAGSPASGWFRVRGVVRNSRNGEPLAGVQLTAKADAPPPYTFNGTTGDDGSYSLDLPATSSFSIGLSAPGYEPKTWQVNAAGWLAIAAAPISPPLSQVPEDGYFRIFGFVKDQYGVPLSGASVSAKPSGMGGKEGYYITDASGFYFLDWPKWKAVLVKAEKKGYNSKGVSLQLGPPPPVYGEGGPMVVFVNPSGPTSRRIEQLPADGMVQQDLTVQSDQPKVITPPTPRPNPTPAPNPVPQVDYGLFHYSSYNAGTVDIFLDGRYLGTNPLYNIPVGVGWHRLRVVTPGGMVIIDKSLYMSPGGRWLFN